jgi:glycosyltransferase involved in cell wall biosynthesis
MAMGLPVITTNWGGSTEFVREQWGYLIELDGLTDTSASDPWLRGFKWAKPRLDHLRQLMRQVYSNREDAQKMGARARRAVLERFSPVVVANQYAKRLTEIERTVPLVASHGEQVLASFDRKWGLTARFKACSVSQRLVRRPMRRNDSALCDMILVTTFPPRECGIATFAEALLKGLQSICPRGSRLEVLVVKHQDDPISSYNSTLVKTAIREFEAYDYTHAAEYINNNSFRSVLLQFEYGIFPGASILCFAKAVQAPLITTLHTVARSTSEEFHSMMQQFALLSNKVRCDMSRMFVSVAFLANSDCGYDEAHALGPGSFSRYSTHGRRCNPARRT